MALKKTSLLIRDFPEESESSPRGGVRMKGRHRGEETREDLNEKYTERRGRRQGRQAAFLWPQLRELQSLNCSCLNADDFWTRYKRNKAARHVCFLNQRRD